MPAMGEIPSVPKLRHSAGAFATRSGDETSALTIVAVRPRMHISVDAALLAVQWCVMAAPLKDFFDERLVRRIANTIAAVHSDFPTEKFVAQSMAGLSKLELLDRGKHVADALAKTLPNDYEQAVDILMRSLDVPATREDSAMAAFLYLPHVTFVARWGLEHFDASMRAQHALTQRFSAEFSIRYFIRRDADRTLEVLRSWANDKSEHVRRLVSEGTRPRLPWAVRLPAFIANPAPVLELLELLRDDPALYVRRSVANNLNDIAKDHPDVVVDVCKRWSVDATPERKWIIQHALRWLVKRGFPGAITLLGGAARPKVRIEGVNIEPARAQLGSVVRFAFDVVSEATKKQILLVDYIVHHPGASGKTRSKVWKLRRIELEAKGRARLEAKVSLVDRTIRKHYPGTYRIDVRIGATDLPLGSFDVAAPAVSKPRPVKAKRANA